MNEFAIALPFQHRIDAAFDAGFLFSGDYVKPDGDLTPEQIAFDAGVNCSRKMLAQVFGEPEAEREAS